MNEENKKPEPVFPKGIIFKKPKDGAPDFIRGHLSFKVDEACDCLRANENNGWVNIDIKKSKEGKTYLQINTWKKPIEEVTPDISPEDIPF